MKPATPRKSRKGKQPANIAGPSSNAGYESDAPATNPLAAPATEAAGPDPAYFAEMKVMNLRVLRRSLPTTQSFEIIANIASVYQWGFHDDGWGEVAFKGVLFLCHMQPVISPTTGQLVARESLFLHNRLSLQNLEIDMASVNEINRQAGEERMFTLETFNHASGASIGWGLLLTDCGNLAAAWDSIQRAWTAARGGAP